MDLEAELLMYASLLMTFCSVHICYGPNALLAKMRPTIFSSTFAEKQPLKSKNCNCAEGDTEAQQVKQILVGFFCPRLVGRNIII